VAVPLWISHEQPAPLAACDRSDASEAWQEFLCGGWLVTRHLRGPGAHALVAWSGPGFSSRDLLTPQELEAARLRSTGQSVKVIAAESGHSVSNAATRIQSALRKLMISTEADLVRFFAACPDAMSASLTTHGDRRCVVLTYEVPPWSLPTCLTHAERRVVEALLGGGSQQSVAGACGISPRTVANHVASLHRKLNVHSRVELFVALCKRAEESTPELPSP
jgi:DNA-binding NarL/FixJ family response regulator